MQALVVAQVEPVAVMFPVALDAVTSGEALPCPKAG